MKGEVDKLQRQTWVLQALPQGPDLRIAPLTHEAIHWLAQLQEGVLHLLAEQLLDGDGVHLWAPKGMPEALGDPP